MGFNCPVLAVWVILALRADNIVGLSLLCSSPWKSLDFASGWKFLKASYINVCATVDSMLTGVLSVLQCVSAGYRVFSKSVDPNLSHWELASVDSLGLLK